MTGIRVIDENGKPRVGFAGLQGAVWATPDGKPLRAIAIHSKATHVDFLDVDDDGTLELLHRGGASCESTQRQVS